MKRVLDVTVASVCLVVFSIPMALVAVMVRRKLGSPILFRQMRPGVGGVAFELIKFRTMTDDRDMNGDVLFDSCRITPVSAFLRSTSLDELPSLWNVLKGDLSLVGPRPLLIRYTQYFTAEESIRLHVRPGITGWAQVHGRNSTSWDQRLALDVWYVRNHSILLDLKILGLTTIKVFRRDGVVVDPESVMLNLDDERRNCGNA